MLNVNQSVTALIAGQLIPNDDHDILIIGYNLAIENRSA